MCTSKTSDFTWCCWSKAAAAGGQKLVLVKKLVLLLVVMVKAGGVVENILGKKFGIPKIFIFTICLAGLGHFSYLQILLIIPSIAIKLCGGWSVSECHDVRKD